MVYYFCEWPSQFSKSKYRTDLMSIQVCLRAITVRGMQVTCLLQFSTFMPRASCEWVRFRETNIACGLCREYFYLILISKDRYWSWNSYVQARCKCSSRKKHAFAYWWPVSTFRTNWPPRGLQAGLCLPHRCRSQTSLLFLPH